MRNVANRCTVTKGHTDTIRSAGRQALLLGKAIEMKSRSFSKGAAPDLWRQTLSQIPSMFGRLVYLAMLRDSNTGEYQHHGLATVFGEEEANKAMRQSHEDVFAEWLAYTLAQQKQDLELYVAGLEPDRRKVVETWSKLEPYR